MSDSKVVPIKAIRALIKVTRMPNIEHVADAHNQAVTDLNEYADFPVTNQMTGLLFSQAYTDYVAGIDGEIPTYLQWLEVRILAAEAKLEAMTNLTKDAAAHLREWLNENCCDCDGPHICGRGNIQRTVDCIDKLLEQTK